MHLDDLQSIALSVETDLSGVAVPIEGQSQLRKDSKRKPKLT